MYSQSVNSPAPPPSCEMPKTVLPPRHSPPLRPFLSGRVLKCNIAKPMQHKLGATKAVWSTDEWFKTQLAEDKDLGDQLDFEELVPEAAGK